MAQFIRTPVEHHPDFWNEATQVSQVVYHDQRVTTIDYEHATNRIIVHDNGELFYLTSPDIEDITMLQVLQHLGYGDEQIVVTFVDDNRPNALLNTPVRTAALNQISLYGPNDIIPLVHNVGPFPNVFSNPNQEIIDNPNPNGPHNPNEAIPDNANPNNQDVIGPFQGVDAVAPDNDSDTNSTLSDIPNFTRVEHFGDSDNDDYHRYD